MRRALGHATHISTAGAYERWVSTASETRRQRAICSRVLDRLQNRLLGNALCSWRMFACHRRRCMHIVARTIVRMRRSIYWSVFHSWLGWVSNERELVNRRATEERQIVETIQQMADLRAKMYSCWASIVLERKRQVKRVVERCTRNHIYFTYSKWKQGVSLFSWRRATLSRAINRLQHRGTVQAFNCWQTVIRNKHRHRSIVGRVIRRMRGYLCPSPRWPRG